MGGKATNTVLGKPSHPFLVVRAHCGCSPQCVRKRSYVAGFAEKSVYSIFDELIEASSTGPDDNCSKCHCLKAGIGQVVGQRWQGHEVGVTNNRKELSVRHGVEPHHVILESGQFSEYGLGGRDPVPRAKVPADKHEVQVWVFRQKSLEGLR